MPPSKRKAVATGTAATSADPPVSLLLGRCPRVILENLLAEAVASGKPVTYAQVQAALPEAKQSTMIVRPTVSTGQTREGTGYFDLIDDEVLVAILSNIKSTETLLNVAIAVCKAWRGALKRPELFTHLGMYASYGAYTTGGVKIVSVKVPKLMQWLPDVAAITSLAVDTGGKHQSISPDVLKKVLATSFTDLTSLKLSGKKVTAAVLAVAAKQRWAANLRSFELGDTDAKPSDALALLSRATRLEELSISQYGFSDGILSNLSTSWREARGGGAVPLLRIFNRTGTFATLAWNDFRRLPELFPELEDVAVGLSLSYTAQSLTGEPLGVQNLRLLKLTLTSLIVSCTVSCDRTNGHCSTCYFA